MARVVKFVARARWAISRNAPQLQMRNHGFCHGFSHGFLAIFSAHRAAAAQKSTPLCFEGLSAQVHRRSLLADCCLAPAMANGCTPLLYTCGAQPTWGQHRLRTAARLSYRLPSVWAWCCLLLQREQRDCCSEAAPQLAEPCRCDQLSARGPTQPVCSPRSLILRLTIPVYRADKHSVVRTLHLTAPLRLQNPHWHDTPRASRHDRHTLTLVSPHRPGTFDIPVRPRMPVVLRVAASVSARCGTKRAVTQSPSCAGQADQRSTKQALAATAGLKLRFAAHVLAVCPHLHAARGAPP